MYSVMSDSLWPHGMWPARPLCPWNFLGKNTGVGSHFLLQGIFSTQGVNLHILHLQHWQADSLALCHLGSPIINKIVGLVLCVFLFCFLIIHSYCILPKKICLKLIRGKKQNRCFITGGLESIELESRRVVRHLEMTIWIWGFSRNFWLFNWLGDI